MNNYTAQMLLIPKKLLSVPSLLAHVLAIPAFLLFFVLLYSPEWIVDMLDMQVGTIFTYQQNHKNSETYLQDLKALGYDMLYGKYYIYGGTNPFEKTSMKMGVKEIKIDEIVKIGDKYYIKGQNFNEYSKVTLNGEPIKTIYLGSNILGLLEDVDPEDAPNMKVSQIEKKSNEILSTTE